MERIDPSQQFYHLHSSLRSDEKKTKKSEKTKGFFGQFIPSKDVADASAGAGVELRGEVVDEDQLALLMDDIYKWGGELASNPSPGNIGEYKKRIAIFLRSLILSSIALEENEGRLRKDMKRPKYTLIKVVNQKLDQLAHAILTNQKDKFSILEKTDELHGLLVDLLG